MRNGEIVIVNNNPYLMMNEETGDLISGRRKTEDGVYFNPFKSGNADRLEEVATAADFDQINADSPDSYRGGDAVRLKDETTAVDLSACTAPDNVEYIKNLVVYCQFSSDSDFTGTGRSGDADRLEDETTAADFDQFNADRSGDAVRLLNKAAKGDLSVLIAIGIRPDNVKIIYRDYLKQRRTRKKG